MKKGYLLKLLVLFILSCSIHKQDALLISKEEMLKIAKENGTNFSVAVRAKNLALLTSIYSDSAQYVQPLRDILVGKDSIQKDWKGFLALKEKPLDLILNIHDVRGNREIIYETDDGYTLLADSSRWKFNYVNVWRLQKDDSYKLEVDTYNDRK